MDELLSRFPDIAEDIFESLGDESLVHCKEASRSISSFMEEGNKFWKRIIRKYLHNQDCYDRNQVRMYKLDFAKDWKGFTDLKETKPEILRELGRAVQDYLNRHEGRKSQLIYCIELVYGPKCQSTFPFHCAYTAKFHST